MRLVLCNRWYNSDKAIELDDTEARLAALERQLTSDGATGSTERSEKSL